ncbi:polysaccharide biosynthesis tyrosine autokinase [Alteromonas pelagimontana]|uniref:non-specific protein-tyrosine kinase n=1 Tax=Alteromonas pelagimontana TaxID=1858656 RepID=A0A6M4MBL4_9ALTE|nr:polysaccharide biosynthesis tyrosine autokinase [Alteromonas pelagimontana]QJR80198.1 polysaccharide biosynthesis tyrosine autokinase [Alteromonas pelagimontana]
MSIKMRDQLQANILDDETIDFAHYWQVFKRYAGRIIVLAILFTLLVALVVMKMTPIYSATASLLIESQPANVMSIEEIYKSDTTRKDYMQTQYEIIQSRQVASRAVDELDLANDPVFMPPSDGGIAILNKAKNWIKSAIPFLPKQEKTELTEEQRADKRRQAAINKLMRSIKVSLVDNTQVIEITAISDSPQLAAQIANTMGDVYIENYLQAKVDMTTKATSFLTESMDGLRDKLAEAEKKLSEFYEDNQLVNLSNGVVGLTAEELEQLSDQLIDAQTTLKQNRTIYEQTQRNGADYGALARLPEVLNHPNIQSVRRQEAAALSRVSELSKVYGAKHPQMVAANAELASVRDTLQTQIRDLISSITTQFRAAQERVATLQEEVSTVKAEYRKLSNLENQRRALQRDVDINQQLYNSMFTRLKETSEIGGFESVNARILDPAVPPNNPTAPNKSLLIGAALVVSFGFGVLLAFVLEALNSGVRSVDDVEKKLGQRMLGLIPILVQKRKEDVPLRAFFDNKFHQFSEAVRTLRTSLSLINIEKQNQAILVTSSVPKEGKTTVSINLAFALGQLDKTILIDADLRRPAVGKRFNVPNYQPGLSNLTMKTHSLDECLVHDEQSGIDLICAGSIPSNPQELLAGDGFRALINYLKKHYKYVVVDTAPTQAVSDAMVVSKSCDSVIYVVRADSTSEKMIKNGLGRFLQVGHRVDGVVLNQVDLRKSDVSERYGGFYDQYGYNAHS